ncbi:cobalt-precorrin-7 (C(5))-methyltransferase [Methanonatronarchaeum sp. AMET-Sl]|uniref:cobalt-precorrin-7 (C(5))-methyltransferase n=1 Tax=Methanonatronarchaeum sp. AMET-Sl TaxID=3037654 RepID=UPI00244DBE20|nr:cobalt-precorrin-7 (C(5))-methyltransferase [Methanonatronarchaeum sp. AMET-Sl]WGI17917.1 cobalt-precorrin-7 (C(5))-methyltransferase [Methanonatronarchaeum sp. AMET-Sl]
MKIVGVGIAPGMMTEKAIKTIKKAKNIHGSKRAIEIAKKHIPPDSNLQTIKNYKKLNQLPKNTIILSTGDPMLSGLGYLNGEIINGISSLQYACAKLKKSQTEITPISFHGRTRNYQKLQKQLEINNKVFLITDPDLNIQKLTNKIKQTNTKAQITILNKLGYPDEEITKGTTQNPPKPTTNLYSILIEPTQNQQKTTTKPK